MGFRDKRWEFIVVQVDRVGPDGEALVLGTVIGQGKGPYWYSGDAEQDAWRKALADPRFKGKQISFSVRGRLEVP